MTERQKDPYIHHLLKVSFDFSANKSGWFETSELNHKTSLEKEICLVLSSLSVFQLSHLSNFFAFFEKVFNV